MLDPERRRATDYRFMPDILTQDGMCLVANELISMTDFLIGNLEMINPDENIIAFYRNSISRTETSIIKKALLILEEEGRTGCQSACFLSNLRNNKLP